METPGVPHVPGVPHAPSHSLGELIEWKPDIVLLRMKEINLSIIDRIINNILYSLLF